LCLGLAGDGERVERPCGVVAAGCGIYTEWGCEFRCYGLEIARGHRMEKGLLTRGRWLVPVTW
jgi:hypothetical protein